MNNFLQFFDIFFKISLRRMNVTRIALGVTEPSDDIWKFCIGQKTVPKSATI